MLLFPECLLILPLLLLLFLLVSLLILLFILLSLLALLAFVPPLHTQMLLALGPDSDGRWQAGGGGPTVGEYCVVNTV
jgi:hypothetical protein